MSHMTSFSRFKHLNLEKFQCVIGRLLSGGGAPCPQVSRCVRLTVLCPSQSSVLGARPAALPSHSLWKSQPSSRWRYVARTSRYSGASSASSPGNRTGDSLTSSCSRGPRWQSYSTNSRLAAYGTMRLVRKRRPARRHRETSC